MTVKRISRIAALFAAGMMVSGALSCAGEVSQGLTGDELVSIAENEVTSLYSYDDMSYNIIDDGNDNFHIEITGVENEYRSEYYIPSQIDGIIVRGICDYAFSYSPVTDVRLPVSLYRIESGAFYDCAALMSVKIPSAVKKIGSYAFYHCVLLNDVEIPDGVSEIGGLAFYETPWLDRQTDEFVIVGDGILIDYNGGGKDVVVPGGVKSISSAFYRNETVENVILPEGLEYIGEAAFMGCVSLKNVYLPSTLKKIGDSAFRGCGSLKLDVPEGIETGFMALETGDAD